MVKFDGVIDVESIFKLASKLDLEIKDSRISLDRIDSLQSVDNTNSKSLSYISRLDYVKVPAHTLKGLVLLPSNLRSTEYFQGISASYIATEDPKYLFASVQSELLKNQDIPSFFSRGEVEELFGAECLYISEDARIAKNVEIGKGANISGNVYLLENTRIGDNVTIKPNTTIGGHGFGYATRNGYPPLKIPHFGGVIIGDNVDIGSSVNIDRGVFANTVISDSVKIDNGVHIAHNVIVGERTLIIANSEVSGSVIIGNDVWIAPSVSIREKLKIGNRAFVGLGSVVTKDVEEDSIVFGVPAKSA